MNGLEVLALAVAVYLVCRGHPWVAAVFIGAPCLVAGALAIAACVQSSRLSQATDPRSSYADPPVEGEDA